MNRTRIPKIIGAACLLLLLFFLPVLKGRAEEASSGSAETPVDLWDNGIPVLRLTVDPEEYQQLIESPQHEYRAQNASIRIDVPEGYCSEYGPADESVLGRELALDYIRGRGHSTWLEEKKPFKFKLEQSADFFSMGASKHWVLLANAKDDTLLRNRLMAYLGSRFGLPYTPQFVPVDLVVNGRYMGSYLLGHQIRIGKSRVNIAELSGEDLSEPEISGGYLLALAPDPFEAEINTLTTRRGVRFLVESPDFSEYGEAQQEALARQKGYITDYLQQVEDAVFGENFCTADGISYRELMDADSAARCWWVQEFAFNDDGMVTSSTYLYKDRNGKLCWGPLWDFDRAFWLSESGQDLNFCQMPWLDHLRAYDPDYQALLRSCWEELDQILEEVICDGGILDQYREEIAASWENDTALWHPENTGRYTPEQAVENLRQCLSLRREGIRQIIDSELTRVFDETTKAPAREETAPESQTADPQPAESLEPETPKQAERDASFLSWPALLAAAALPAAALWLFLRARRRKVKNESVPDEGEGHDRT